MKETTTLRDQFAMAALRTIVNDMIGDSIYQETAREAYRYADAMLAVRDESAMAVEEAARFVAQATVFTVAQVITSQAQYRDAYRTSAALLDPSNSTGSIGGWSKLQRARAVLDAHHGITQNGGKS